MPAPADVAVVGCGPVGATLAGLLGRRGLDVVVLERDLDVFPLPRAAHIDHTGLRTIQELGVLDRVLPRMLDNPGLDYVAADGRVLLRIPGDQGSISDLPASMYFHQPEFDRTLRDAAAALPTVDLRLGTAVTAVEQDEGGVTLETTGGPVSASYVVGCDGATSTVRAAAGLGLDDLRFDERWLVVDVVLREPVPTLPPRAVGYCDPARPAFAIPIPDGRHRFELMLLDDEETDAVQQPAAVLELLEPWLPPGSAEVERAAVYFFHGLVAHEWRAGRVLVAGDAAHQMPPFLGQGLNSGLRDAANLAWKLDLVLRGGARDAILDTYGDERRPHVRTVVEAAIALGAMMRDPSEETTPARFTLPPLEPGPLVRADGGALFVQPGRLDDVVGQRFLVLGRTRDALAGSEWWEEKLGALVATPEELGDADGRLARWLDRRGAEVAVVRPDRYVLAAAAELGPIAEALEPLLESR